MSPLLRTGPRPGRHLSLVVVMGMRLRVLPISQDVSLPVRGLQRVQQVSLELRRRVPPHLKDDLKDDTCAMVCLCAMRLAGSGHSEDGTSCVESRLMMRW